MGKTYKYVGRRFIDLSYVRQQLADGCKVCKKETSLAHYEDETVIGLISILHITYLHHNLLYHMIYVVSFPRGHFNLVCTGVCSHTIGKLTHPQTKAGPSIKKNRPIARLCTIKHEPTLTKLQQVLFNFMKTNHSQVELLKRRPV